MASTDSSGLTARHGRVFGSDERQSSPPAPSTNQTTFSLPQPKKESTTSTAYTLPDSAHRSIAIQNEALKCIKEDPSNLGTWDAWHYHWLKLWADFGNWNNRRPLKTIDASAEVLRTYHDSFLFGEVPVSVKTRSTLRAGIFGFIWNVWIFERNHVIRLMGGGSGLTQLDVVTGDEATSATEGRTTGRAVCESVESAKLCIWFSLTICLTISLTISMFRPAQTEFALALLSGVLYVYSTYEPGLRHNWAHYVQNVISIVFIADYLLRLYCEPVRLYWIFSFWGVVNAVSCIPVILVFKKNIHGSNLLRLLTFVRFVRIFSFNNKWSLFGSSVGQQIVILSIATFGVMGGILLGVTISKSSMFSAGLHHFLGVVVLPHCDGGQSFRNRSTQKIGKLQKGLSLDPVGSSLHRFVYKILHSTHRAVIHIPLLVVALFQVLQVATVGYGDITPKTIVGQLIAVITIVGALTIVPLQIGRITALAYRRPYGGSFSSKKIIGSRFLIISGSITFASVQQFLAEFYNPTHSEGAWLAGICKDAHHDCSFGNKYGDLIFYLPDLDVYPLRVIILAPFSPSFELKQLLSLYNGLVEFIEGSPVRQSDLERVSADQASAFFLLADEESENHQVEDAAQIVRALAVHRFCISTARIQRKVRIIIAVLDPETYKSAVWDQADRSYIEVICPVTIHYKLMARSCAVHGLYTLITNLFTSELQLKYLNRRHFLTEYFHSFDNEVYPVILPPAFLGLSFEEVAELIFTNFSSILMAVDTSVGMNPDGSDDRKVLLYPKGQVLNRDDVGIVIASDLHTAYAISTYKSEENCKSVFHNLWVQATTTPTLRRTNQSTELLDPTSGKWRRSSSTVSRAAYRGSTVDLPTAAFGDMDPDSYNPSGHRVLENELRTAIQNVYTAKDYPDWGTNQPATVEVGILQENDEEALEFESHSVQSIRAGTGEPATDSGHRFPKGISLEKAAKELLSWPPLSHLDRPHPALIEEKEDVILKDLKERTISMVAFNVPHILVCCQSGWPDHFFYFLVEIRRPGFPNPPVVMLYPREINAKQWGTVGAFKDIYFLKGSPLYELDLLRGGVLQAEKIVILSDQGVPVDLGGQKGDDNKYLKRTPAAYTSDVENIIVSANVQRLYGHNPHDCVIVEMKHPEAFFYLRPQYEISRAHFPREGFRRNRDALVHFIPPYMEGKAVSGQMLGFLMRSSFYNRNTLSIVDQLIQGGYGRTESGDLNERMRLFDQISVPEQYGNRPYSDLFLSLLQEYHMLAIGLYRVRGTLGAPTAYVLTNPKPDYIVNPDDRIYVLH